MKPISRREIKSSVHSVTGSIRIRPSKKENAKITFEDDLEYCKKRKKALENRQAVNDDT